MGDGLKRAKAAAEATRAPAKRWRVITLADGTRDYSSEQKAYDVLNQLAADANAVAIGTRATIRHWENGGWTLYERVKITEDGWEPA